MRTGCGNLHPLAAAFLFGTVIPVILVRIASTDRLYTWRKRRTETERWVYEYLQMLTGLQNAKEVHLFDLGGVFRQRHRDLRAVLREERLHLAKQRSLADLLAHGTSHSDNAAGFGERCLPRHAGQVEKQGVWARQAMLYSRGGVMFSNEGGHRR